MLMPKIDLRNAGLTPEEFEIAKGIIASRGPNKGRLRASKPKVTRVDLGKDPDDPIGFYHVWEITDGETAYIWRMVAFAVSPLSQHQCMPCTADFDLPGRTRERLECAKRLDGIVDKIVNTMPLAEQPGTLNWGRALGYW